MTWINDSYIGFIIAKYNSKKLQDWLDEHEPLDR